MIPQLQRCYQELFTLAGYGINRTFRHCNPDQSIWNAIATKVDNPLCEKLKNSGKSKPYFSRMLLLKVDLMMTDEPKIDRNRKDFGLEEPLNVNGGPIQKQPPGITLRIRSSFFGTRQQGIQTKPRLDGSLRVNKKIAEYLLNFRIYKDFLLTYTERLNYNSEQLFIKWRKCHKLLVKKV